MEANTKRNFKAVDFMRQERNAIGDIYHANKKQFHRELDKAMADFKNELAVNSKKDSSSKPNKK